MPLQKLQGWIDPGISYLIPFKDAKVTRKVCTTLEKLHRTEAWSRNIIMSFHISIDVERLKRIKVVGISELNKYGRQRGNMFMPLQVSFIQMISYTWEMLFDQSVAYLHRYVSKATGNIFDKYLLIVRHYSYLLWVAQGRSAHFSFLPLVSDISKVAETNINTPRKITTYDLESFTEFDDTDPAKRLPQQVLVNHSILGEH